MDPMCPHNMRHFGSIFFETPCRTKWGRRGLVSERKQPTGAGARAKLRSKSSEKRIPKKKKKQQRWQPLDSTQGVLPRFYMSACLGNRSMDTRGKVLSVLLLPGWENRSPHQTKADQTTYNRRLPALVIALKSAHMWLRKSNEAWHGGTRRYFHV